MFGNEEEGYIPLVYRPQEEEEENKIEKKKKKKKIGEKKLEKLKAQNPLFAIFGRDYLMWVNKQK